MVGGSGGAQEGRFLRVQTEAGKTASERLLARVRRAGVYRYRRWALRHAPQYRNPTPSELEQIEQDLASAGVTVHGISPPASDFKQFLEAGYFPSDYYGGVGSSVWDEKLLEHWLSSELLDLKSYGPDDVYVDVAALSSPWAKILRERFDVQAFAIDLSLDARFADLPYYRVEDATKTSFASGSVRGMSLHCAYEMFLRDDDVKLMDEAARILRPGGKMVILPLYMHTHYCAYSTPEYYGKGYSDPNAKEYVRLDCTGIPSSRKYDAQTLYRRVLSRIVELGMSYRLLAIRNKEELGRSIYCHFVLEVTR